MEFDKEILGYLHGEKFSNGLVVKISRSGETVLDRLKFIESFCANKKVIHLGCVDHLPLIRKKIEQNKWLHARLCKCTQRCLGIDLNKEGIDIMKNNLGYADVIFGDIIEEEIDEIKKNSWDYLVIAEVLEHVDNPLIFLRRIHEKYNDSIDRIIITVPNAFSWQNITYTFSHKECINSDHRYWFTPYTLAKIVTISGMRVESFQFCNSYYEDYKSLSGLIQIGPNILLRLFPELRSNLIMVVKI